MLHFQTPAAAFLAYFKLSLLAGAALSSPLIFLQLWLFVAPGLYAKEKRFVIPFVVSSTALFVGGGYFGWRLVFPIAFEYLLSLSGQVQQGAEGLVVSPTVMMGDYIGFVTRLLLGFGLIFEIPLFVFFMSVTGIVNYLQLIRVTRWVVVGAFAFAAILTPPDWTSQLMMAVPMIGLYGISILLAYIFGKPPSEEQRAAYKKHKEQARVEREADRKRKKKDKEAEKKAKKAKKAEQTRKKTSKGR
jgi:sec-independent protein translocase protein TatC